MESPFVIFTTDQGRKVAIDARKVFSIVEEADHTRIDFDDDVHFEQVKESVYDVMCCINRAFKRQS